MILKIETFQFLVNIDLTFSPSVLFDLFRKGRLQYQLLHQLDKKLCRSLAPIVRGLIEKNAMSATREDM